MKSLFFSLLIIISFNSCGTSNSTTTITVDEFKPSMEDYFTYFDTTIWQKADWANGDPFYNGWCPEQINFDTDEILTIKLEKKDCNLKTHSSGEYRTYDTFKYGRYTTKFQASDVNGTISSLFTYTGANEGTAWDEIDIEILGKDPSKVQVNYWRDGHEHPIILDLGFDASEDMHTYSFIWHQDYIKWYVDDILVYTVTENNLNDNDSLPVNAGKIMINLWAGTGIDSWSGSYEDNTTVEVYYDFVRFEEFN